MKSVKEEKRVRVTLHWTSFSLTTEGEQRRIESLDFKDQWLFIVYFPGKKGCFPWLNYSKTDLLFIPYLLR